MYMQPIVSSWRSGFLTALTNRGWGAPPAGVLFQRGYRGNPLDGGRSWASDDIISIYSN